MIFPELLATEKVKVTTIKSERGEIYDRTGRLLAGKGEASMVGLVPGKLGVDKANDIIRLAELLGVSPDQITQKLEAGWVTDESLVPVKIIEKIDEVNLLSENPDQQNQQNRQLQDELLTIPGVMISNTTLRTYPMKEKAAHLIGYVQAVTAEDLEQHPDEGYHSDSVIGRSGMEALYETELKGSDGKEILIVDANGEKKTTIAIIPKVDGETIVLTIDADLQSTLYDQFQQDKSCSVAMNPYTGEVLALVSTPSYDNNEFIRGMSTTMWDTLNADEQKPLYNRFRQRWCPGSSFKPLIGAIGLTTGAIDPTEDYGNVGLSWQKDSSWGNYHVTTLHSTAPVTLENALINSDNIYFAKVALEIGSSELIKALEQLGFNQEFPFDIVMAQAQYSNGDLIETEIQLADSGYGQGQILINPLHLATLYTAFVNDGDIIKPSLRKAPEALGEIWLSQAFSADVANQIKADLEKVVSSSQGTGHGAYREDIRLAAKTGTAEIKASKADVSGTELGWFAVFTTNPESDKPLLLVSMVEDVKDIGGSGYVVKKTTAVINQYIP